MSPAHPPDRGRQPDSHHSSALPHPTAAYPPQRFDQRRLGALLSSDQLGGASSERQSVIRYAACLWGQPWGVRPVVALRVAQSQGRVARGRNPRAPPERSVTASRHSAPAILIIRGFL